MCLRFVTWQGNLGLIAACREHSFQRPSFVLWLRCCAARTLHDLSERCIVCKLSDKERSADRAFQGRKNLRIVSPKLAECNSETQRRHLEQAGRELTRIEH